MSAEMSTENATLPDHRCRSGKRCVARSGTAAAAVAKPSTICPACIAGIQTARDSLPAMRDAVRVFVGIKPATAMQSKVAATKTPSSPLNLVAETIVTDIDDVLTRVGNYLIRDLVSQPSARFKVWRGDAEQLVYWDGVDLALQVRSVHSRANRLLGFEQQWQRRSAPCWECGLPCLGQLTGSETVECSGCGVRKPDSEYQQYCVDLVRGKQ